MTNDDYESELTLDELPQDRRPIHCWQRPENIPIDSMTPSQLAELDRPSEENLTIDARFEMAIQSTGVPVQYVAAIMNAIADVREAECTEREVETVHQLVWSLNGADGAAFRRALGFDGDKLRESAELSGVPKTTLDRKTKRLKEKWDSLTHKVQV